MTRQHPVHDTIAALTRVQRDRIWITDAVSYRVEAPCLLQQLHEAVALGTETGGRGVPGSRANVAIDALDLWREILHSTHSWADALNVDRSPHRQPSPAPRPAPAERAAVRQPAPWYATLAVADDTPTDILTQIGDRLDPVTSPHIPPTPRRQIPDPDRIHQLPPVGRLLRHVAGAATSAGLDQVADAIHRSAERWRRHIEEMLTGQAEQRGVRGAACPTDDCPALCSAHLAAYCDQPGCRPTTVLEDRDDGRYPVPTIVLTVRDVAGETLRWLTCLACGWSRGLDDLAPVEELAA